jgi:hypothetical protein
MFGNLSIVIKLISIEKKQLKTTNLIENLIEQTSIIEKLK